MIGNTLPPGLIFIIAVLAKLIIPESGAKRAVCCPFHKDKHPSAFLSENNVFFCFLCTPNGGIGAKAFAERLGVNWHLVLQSARDRPYIPTPDEKPTILLPEIQRVYSCALVNARKLVTKDNDADRFLAGRGLAAARGKELYGILDSKMDLPAPVAPWPERGFLPVVPLFSLKGEIVNFQARSTRASAKVKTMFPKGAPAAETLFSNAAGLEILRDYNTVSGPIFFGEGLTDFLALASSTKLPVLCIPGTGFAKRAVSGYAKDRRVLLVLDCDTEGDKAAGVAAEFFIQYGARSVERIRWPQGQKDACDSLKLLGAAQFSKFLEIHASQRSNPASA